MMCFHTFNFLYMTGDTGR